jgi:hypothetical protein
MNGGVERLYLTGNFSSVGNEPIAYLAVWDGGDWHAVDESISDRVFACQPLLLDHELALFASGPGLEAGLGYFLGGNWYPMMGPGKQANSFAPISLSAGTGVVVGGNFRASEDFAAENIALWNFDARDCD